MTYRERRLRRAERLRTWAESRRRKSDAAFKRADTIAQGIPLGQPILVGHHSEKRHRRDLDRIDAGMSQGVEHQRKAHQMTGRAAEIERQADHAIYSDDVDALDRMRERIADLEAKRDRMKDVNKAIRKHGLKALIQQPCPPFLLTDEEKRELLKLMDLCPYHHIDTKGFPSYALQNLGGNITRNRARLADLETRAAQRARVREVLDAETKTSGIPNDCQE
jgi:hypothetical protein